MHELKSGILFLAMSLLVFWESFRVGLGDLRKPGAGFLAFCAAVVLIVFSLVYIYKGWRLREPPKKHPRLVIIALGSLFAYSLALSPLGFVPATFLLVGGLFHIQQRRPWCVLLGMSALVTSVAYVVFGMLLHIYFPKGFLGF
jgi:putative tricarboxylic transport membrane protein